MIDIAGTLVNPGHIVSAHVETRHYMNGCSSALIVLLDNGKEIRAEHGYGFDAHRTLDRIRLHRLEGDAA